MRTALLIGLAIVGLTLIQVPTADAQPPWRDRYDRRNDDRRGDEERRRDRGRDGQRSRDDSDRDDDRGNRDGGRSRFRGGGGFPGGGGPGGGNREDFWKQQDRNGDGKISPDEIPFFLRDRVRIESAISIDELVSRSPGRRGDGDREERGRDGRRGRDRNDSDRAPEKPLVPGFGVDSDENAMVPGFGPPEKVETEAAVTGSTDSSESRTASTTGGGGGITGNTYVNGVLDKFDANKNRILEGEEISNSKLPPGTDADSDGKITREELVKAFPSKSPSSSANGAQNEARRSYRFASAQERLPSSAKSWIVSRDKNGDGQVAMHEFSRTWSDSKVREFQRYDLNGDGVVTAEEYLAR